MSSSRPVGEVAFAESLANIRLALGALEDACAADPTRCRRAAAVLERFQHEVDLLAAASGLDYDYAEAI